MADPVKYVSFGGAQVPAGTRREVIDKNGQKMYCVWTDNNGGKVTYPEQPVNTTFTTCYMKSKIGHDSFGHSYAYTQYTSKEMYQHALNDNMAHQNYFNGKKESAAYVSRENLYNVLTTYYKSYVDNNPRIKVSTDSGMIYDTQNVTLSNMRGATVTGSTDEDNITLMNSSNCTVDVSNANNNMFVSDNVRVVNGQGNKVKAGDHDQVTFGTHNYETNTNTVKANYKGEATYKQ